MWFNVYLVRKTGEYRYGFSHPTKQYAKAVRNMPCKREACIGTVFIACPMQEAA